MNEIRQTQSATRMANQLHEWQRVFTDNLNFFFVWTDLR